MPCQGEIFQICYCSLLSLFICMYWPSKTSTHSQSEIFFVIVDCSYILAFEDHDSLPDKNMQMSSLKTPSPAVTESLWPWISRAFQPQPSVAFTFKTWPVLSATDLELQDPASRGSLWPSSSEASVSLTFQANISIIVACSYVLAFQYHNTLPKWNIFCYCRLLVSLPSITTTPSQSEIFSALHCMYILVLQVQLTKHILLVTGSFWLDIDTNTHASYFEHIFYHKARDCKPCDRYKITKCLFQYLDQISLPSIVLGLQP